MRYLTNNFTLPELTHTEVRKYDNTPPDAIIPNIIRTANKLEEVRALLGSKPINVNSCYRSRAVNKAIGGSKTSKHMEGLAADFTCQTYGSPLAIVEAIAKSDISFDQLILEFFNPATGRGWVHIGLAAKNRKQILTINPHGTFSGIHP